MLSPRLGSAALLLRLFALPSSAGAAGFPCALESLPYRPELLLIGENHCDDGSDQVWLAAARGGAKGSYILALENVYPGDEARRLGLKKITLTASSRVSGIDDPFTHGLALSYLAAFMIPVCESSDHELAANVIGFATVNPHVAMAWHRVTLRENGFASSNLRREAELIDRALIGYGGWETEVERLGSDGLDRLRILFRKINAEYVAEANRRTGGQNFSAVPESLTPAAEVQARAAEKSAKRIILPVRDRQMADELAPLYCRAAAERKELVAVVGDAHVPGLTKLLEQRSSGRVKVRYRASHKETENTLRDLELMGATAFNGAPRISPRLNQTLLRLQSALPARGPF